jgi:hypothetical protein
MSAIPVMGSPMYPFQRQRGQEPWVIVQQLRADYEVVEVPMGTDKIDTNIKVLIVLHPADITESAEYAIDQFLLGGGKVIAFVDPNSVVAQAFSGQQNPMTGQPGGQINTASDLKNLLKAWGVGFKNDMVIADMNYRGMLQGRNNPTALLLPAGAINADDRSVTAKGDADDKEAIREFAIAYLRHEQDLDLRAFGVTFDVFSLESALYKEGKVDATVKQLIESGHTYEEGDALWLRTTHFGDDKDRVMRKKEGGYTYFVPDVAYHAEKWNRGFGRVINEQGADHHSTITRVRAGLQAMNIGIPHGWPDYVLHQMVTVMRNGEEVKISKRAGSYVTLRDLIDEVGCDATRYFLAARRADSQLVFDIDLARAQTNDNPVYYIQYAHARICQVLAQWGGDVASLKQADLSPLTVEHELALMQRLAEFPELVETAAQELAPSNIANYLKELASDLHSYYNAQQFLVDDEKIKQARLALICATQQVIRSGLNLLGVNAPEKM